MWTLFDKLKNNSITFQNCPHCLFHPSTSEPDQNNAEKTNCFSGGESALQDMLTQHCECGAGMWGARGQQAAPKTKQRENSVPSHLQPLLQCRVGEDIDTQSNHWLVLLAWIELIINLNLRRMVATVTHFYGTSHSVSVEPSLALMSKTAPPCSSSSFKPLLWYGTVMLRTLKLPSTGTHFSVCYISKFLS